MTIISFFFSPPPLRKLWALRFFSPAQRIKSRVDSAASKLERSHSAVKRNKKNYIAFALGQDSHLSRSTFMPGTSCELLSKSVMVKYIKYHKVAVCEKPRLLSALC